MGPAARKPATRSAAARRKAPAKATTRRRTTAPSGATATATVAGYLAAQPADRRAVLEQVRDLVLAHLPEGYDEAFNWGMISWEIPLSRCPVTYNKRPLSFGGLAARKDSYTLYLIGPAADPSQMRMLKDGFVRAGKKLDMGKSCIHFRAVEDLPLDVIARVVASMPVDTLIRIYERPRK
jgi:hypothetical protein